MPITNASAFSQLRLAEAARDEAIAAVDSEEANLTAAQHRVKQDEAVYARAERDHVRWQSLVESGVVSRSNTTLVKRRHSQMPSSSKPIAPRLSPNNTKSDNCAV